MADFDLKCAQLGIDFFEVPPPMANYSYAVQDRDHIYLSGHGPFEGPDNHQRYSGKVGRDLSPLEAKEVARFTMIGCLSTLRSHIGTLNRVKKVIRVTSYVNADPDCQDYFRATDGASELLLEIFGETGRHSRMSVGCSVTPLQVPIALDMTVRIE